MRIYAERMHYMTHGNGVIKVANPANNAVAPTVPRRLYIGPDTSGKTAAKADRRNEFPAIADAAYGLYATTRKVKTEVKT